MRYTATTRSEGGSPTGTTPPLPQWTTRVISIIAWPTVLTPERRGTTPSVPRMLIGAGIEVSCTDTPRPGINWVKIPPISGAHASQGDDASSLPTIRSITPTSSTQTYAHTTGTTQDKSCEVITRKEEGRLGNGPGNGQDSLSRWLGRQTGERERVFTPQSGKRPDEDRDTSTRWLERRGPEQILGEAGSVTETETGRRAGGGVDRLDDSRLNFRSRLGPRPSTGGDVTILTPFSTSPMTDASVDALPTLFLAYCAVNHAYSTLAD